MESVNIWSDIGDAQVLHGDCLDKLRGLKKNSIDAIITDPPYGIGFMGNKWDASVPALEWAEECLRVLKPGGHIVAFASTRTYHRLAVNLEDAGFEIRDMVSWIFFSGFPKSQNISKRFDQEAGVERDVVGWDQSVWRDPDKNRGKSLGHDFKYYDSKCTITKPKSPLAVEYEGYGTALKPSQEPACLARKPIEKGLTIAQNVAKYGTGGLNIEECRFAFGDPCWVGPNHERKRLLTKSNPNAGCKNLEGRMQKNTSSLIIDEWSPKGRWPANIYHSPKAGRSERDQGLDHLVPMTGADAVKRKEGSAGINNPRAGAGRTASLVANFHPTVKPLKLFRWLCKLLGGKKGNVILDPFLGSGTTAAAAILEGYNVIGCEREESYLPIIEGRINWAIQEYKYENAQLPLFEEML